MKVTDLIADFGGLTQMSKKINVPISTIQSWGRQNKIPTWRISVIIEACKKQGIDISDCEKNNIDISDCYESEE